MDELPGVDFAAVAKDRLYRCLDRLVAHKDALHRHLVDQWRTLFDAKFDILLYDLTSTYFEGQCQQIPKARHGYSRDGRPDCRQVVIALVVTPDGLPPAYEVLAGNTADKHHAEDLPGPHRGSPHQGAGDPPAQTPAVRQRPQCPQASAGQPGRAAAEDRGVAGEGGAGQAVRDIPSEVFLSRDDGMPRDCAVNCDHLQTVSKGRIGALITSLSPAKIAAVGRALRFALNIGNQ